VTLKHSHLHEQRQVDPRAYDFFLRGKYYFAKCAAENSVYARQLFTQALRVDPTYGRVWAWLAYSYGFEYMFLDGTDTNRDEALRDPIVLYDAACFYAMLGKSRKALDSLEKCVLKVGSINREWLENDSDLDSIRDHPRFANIIAAIN
jgi:tetratricopeptide (TPR) repeat protein